MTKPRPVIVPMNIHVVSPSPAAAEYRSRRTIRMSRMAATARPPAGKPGGRRTAADRPASGIPPAPKARPHSNRMARGTAAG